MAFRKALVNMTTPAKLNALSKDAPERQIKDVDGEPLMQRDGQMQLYEGKQEFRASLEGCEIPARAD